MPFFPRFQYPQHSVASRGLYPSDLFRVLDTLPAAFQEATGGNSGRAFSPNFDVHETETEYVLEGELAGLDKKDLSLDFTDDNTLLIRGKIERSVKRQSDDQGKISSAEEPSDKAAEAEKKEEKEEEKKEETQVAKESKKEVGQAQGPKYWVSERTVGEFHRSFSFPGSIDIEAVKASLENGILKIVVPKKEKPTGKKIAIN